LSGRLGIATILLE